MKNIITVQHTQSVHHNNGMIGSWTDWALTEEGLAQARRIGQNLAPEVVGKGYVLYTSDLLRARQTAEAIGEALGIAPVPADALRERNLGEAVGKSKQWAEANTIVWERTIDDRAFAGAETRREAWLRLKAFLDALMATPAENILLVSHGDALSLLHAMWLGLPPEMLNHSDLFGYAGGVSFLYEHADGKRVIRRLSDLSYAIKNPHDF